MSAKIIRRYLHQLRNCRWTVIKDQDHLSVADITSLYRYLHRPHELVSQDRSQSWRRIYTNIHSPMRRGEGGKWLIFHDGPDIDGRWESIKEALNNGLLGPQAKVSTALSCRYDSTGRAQHVICVYTNNFSDFEDVMRVRTALYDLGYDFPLHYKREIDTINCIEFYLYTV